MNGEYMTIEVTEGRPELKSSNMNRKEKNSHSKKCILAIIKTKGYHCLLLYS